MGSDGQHAPRTRKHRRPCAKHVHDTEVRAHTCLHGLFSVKHSYQPGTFQCTSSCNNRLRCRWIPQRTIKLRVAWQVMDNTRPVRTNTADRAPHTLVTQGYVRVLVCTVCLSVQHSYQPGTFQCTTSWNFYWIFNYILQVLHLDITKWSARENISLFMSFLCP